jgi:hypothetical protein
MRLSRNSGSPWVGMKKPALPRRVCVRLGYGLLTIEVSKAIGVIGIVGG